MMTAKKSFGQTAPPRNVRVVPMFNKKPDMEKLARAIISTAEKRKLAATSGKEDAMT